MTTLTPKVETNPDLKKVPTLDLHSFCEIIPPCTEAQFKELKEDMGSKCRSNSSRPKSSMGVIGTMFALSLRTKGIRWSSRERLSWAALRKPSTT
jgi:hypothetical protein